MTPLEASESPSLTTSDTPSDTTSDVLLDSTPIISSQVEESLAKANREEEYPPEVEIIDLEGRRLVLVGTAHISRQSVELVRRVIERERPDKVCIELDPKRYQSLTQHHKWESLDLKEIIRQKQLATLLVNLVLASYQKKLGGQLGVEPGKELLEAAQVAEELGIPVALCDRDVRITLRRAAAATPLFRKLLLSSELLLTLLESPEISEEQLEELKQGDMLTELLQEVGARYPTLKTALIDERDAYLKESIVRTEGNCLVAVVGAGHLRGIVKLLAEQQPVDLEALDQIPAPSPWWKVVGWTIPAMIIGSLAWIGWSQGLDKAGENLLVWVLANGSLTALGAIIAGSHPLTILAGFVAAPFTSLSPLVGAHFVTTFVQAWLRPPLVKELKSVSEDIGHFRGWWNNRLLRIFLCFILTGMGSVLGTLIGGGKILSDLF
jgi:pheromone shutdown-related protein TraB